MTAQTAQGRAYGHSPSFYGQASGNLLGVGQLDDGHECVVNAAAGLRTDLVYRHLAEVADLDHFLRRQDNLPLHVCLVSRDPNRALLHFGDLFEPPQYAFKARRRGHVKHQENGVKILKVVLRDFLEPLLARGVPDNDFNGLFIDENLQLELVNADGGVRGLYVEFFAVHEPPDQAGFADV